MDLQHCLSTRLSETKRWRCREMERALRNARNTTSPVTNFLPVSQTRFDSRSNSLPFPPASTKFSPVSAKPSEMIRGKGGNIWLYPAGDSNRTRSVSIRRPLIFFFEPLRNRGETRSRSCALVCRFQLRQIYRQLINNRRGVNCSRFCFDFPLCVQYRVERLSMTTMTMTTMMTMMITITIIIIIIRSEIVSRT